MSLLAPREVYCETHGFKYIQNYSRRDYNEEPQNWCILQDKRGIIYVGNHGGVLEFDGVSWRTIRVPHNSVRSMAMDGAGTIYVGGEGVMGYLKPDARGTLQYESLLEYLGENQRNVSRVQKAHWTAEGVYFQTRESLFRWHSGRLEVLEGKSHFRACFKCGERLFVRQERVGLVRVKGSELKKVPGGEIFADKTIFLMAPLDSRRILIGTRSRGFYTYDGKKMETFPTEAADYSKRNLLSYGIRLSSGDFALVTLRGGLIIIDSRGRVKDIFTRESGLQDDNVKWVYEDLEGNLWLALDKGIAKVEYLSPLSIYDERSHLLGHVLSVVRRGDRLYVGTTRGLYSLVSPTRFRLIAGMSSNCWSLLSIGDSLLAATSGGVYRVKDNLKSLVIKRTSYILLPSRVEPGRVWVGTNSGLVSLSREEGSGRWVGERPLKNVTQEIRTIAEDKRGNLWLGTPPNGVVRVDSRLRGETAGGVIRYGTSHGLPPGEVLVFDAGGHVMFASSERGLFRFDERGGRFVPDSTLGEAFAGGEEARGVFRVAEDENRDIWFHSRSRNYRAVRRADGTYDIRRRPFGRIPLAGVNAIYPDPSGNVTWFAGNDGLIRYDMEVKKNYRDVFPTLIRRVVIDGDLFFGGNKRGIEGDADDRGSGHAPPPEIEWENRNLRFVFAAPFFEAEGRTEYQYFLEGMITIGLPGPRKPRRITPISIPAPTGSGCRPGMSTATWGVKRLFDSGCCPPGPGPGGPLPFMRF